MTSREAEQDRHGENFCQIEFDNFYHPIRSGQLVQLAREVWSIMDAEQRMAFIEAEDMQQGDELPSIGTPWTPSVTFRAVPGQQIPDDGGRHGKHPTPDRGRGTTTGLYGDHGHVLPRPR